MYYIYVLGSFHDRCTNQHSAQAWDAARLDCNSRGSVNVPEMVSHETVSAVCKHGTYTLVKGHETTAMETNAGAVTGATG